jgi:hypothetical protein
LLRRLKGIFLRRWFLSVSQKSLWISSGRQ